MTRDSLIARDAESFTARALLEFKIFLCHTLIRVKDTATSPAKQPALQSNIHVSQTVATEAADMLPAAPTFGESRKEQVVHNAPKRIKEMRFGIL